MPAIDVSAQVYERLLRQSISFDDTPNDVIGRLLDEAGDEPRSNGNNRITVERLRSPAPPGSILPVREYWLPILSILADVGGSAPATDVIAALEQRMGAVLKERDRETLRNGEVRWRNRARFARLRMKERGLLSDTSHRGIWEITELGRAYLKLNQATKV